MNANGPIQLNSTLAGSMPNLVEIRGGSMRSRDIFHGSGSGLLQGGAKLAQVLVTMDAVQMRFHVPQRRGPPALFLLGVSPAVHLVHPPPQRPLQALNHVRGLERS